MPDFLQSYWMDLIYAILAAVVSWIGKGKYAERQAKR